MQGTDAAYILPQHDAGKVSDCLRCGKCEKICPQHLSIREPLKDVAREFEGEA